MKLVARGAVLCFLVLLSLMWEYECDDKHAEVSERRREQEKAEEQNQQQTQTFTEGEEQNGQNENPDPQADSHRINGTETLGNETSHSVTSAAKPKTSTPPTVKPILPVQTGVKAQEEEQSSGMSIFFSLLVIGRVPQSFLTVHMTINTLNLECLGVPNKVDGICIILVHLLIRFKLHFLPESVAVVSLVSCDFADTQNPVL
ncbi:hypothetical protein QTP70_034779 [Hemibagrus guttatus]|uniref:Uncharacterized protein n=1 Tax=Hemibagrus guttatus TaxID=175788 RepID=A0AAE0UTB7_9TELE|nr:hypothetical protein QTP70_034779 [Hemibagrus guttatus]